MAEIQMQQQGQSLRTGFFDRDAFQRKARTILVLKTAVAGMYFHLDSQEDGQEILKSLTPGTELRLFRDTNNEHDKWAISVYTPDDREIGYVSRFKNETIARLMDYGKGLCRRAATAPEGRNRSPPHKGCDRGLPRAVLHLYG